MKTCHYPPYDKDMTIRVNSLTPLRNGIPGTVALLSATQGPGILTRCICHRSAERTLIVRVCEYVIRQSSQYEQARIRILWNGKIECLWLGETRRRTGEEEKHITDCVILRSLRVGALTTAKSWRCRISRA